jgi:hypothetical protein
MKKNISFVISMLAAATICASAVSAKNLVVNEKDINVQTVNDNNFELVPVRATAEELGFDVEWDGENKSVVLSDLPRYVTFSIGTDGYTFARTAAMPLGHEPVIVDGTAYVPVELFNKLLDYDVEESDDTIKINDNIDVADEVETGSAVDADVVENDAENDEDNNAEEVAVESTEVTVTEIGDGTITVNDEEKGEVVLAIDENFVITDSEGNEIPFEDITVNTVLNVVYGDAMTMSLPPVNNPESIVVVK